MKIADCQFARPRAAWLLVACLLATGPAAGEAVWTEQYEDGGQMYVVRMQVTPADEPTPAFKYRFTTPPHQQVPGNSVAHYMRAFFEGGVDRNWKHLRDKYGEAVDDWYGTDIAISALPLEQVREAARTFDGTVENYVKKGAKCRDTDWGVSYVDIRGPEVVSFLLPEIQSMRSLGRAMSLHTRVAIAEGRYDDAVDEIRMSYRLGRDVGEQPILVSNLVGLAICGIANQSTTELIAAENSPNLYWALTELPRPQVSMREAMRLEMSIGARMFDILDDPESKKYAPEEWNALWKRDAIFLDVDQMFEDADSSYRNSVVAKFLPLASGLAGYSRAKQRLIDGGYDAEEVEAMAVGQVLAIYSSRAVRIASDEMEKIAYLDLSDGRQVAREANERLEQMSPLGDGPDREILPIASLLLPAVQAAQNAQHREMRNLDALRVIEALRMHAAQNDGRWPATLAEITCVPVPKNLATEEPFEYELIGETAILTLPESDGFHFGRRYELTIAE